MAKGRHEAARVNVEEQLRLSVNVYFDVFVVELLVLEGNPDTVDEGAVGISIG